MSQSPISSLPHTSGVAEPAPESRIASGEATCESKPAPANVIHQLTEQLAAVRNDVASESGRLKALVAKLQAATTRTQYLMKLAARRPPVAGTTSERMNALSTWTSEKSDHTRHFLESIESVVAALARQCDAIWALSEEDTRSAAQHLAYVASELERIK